MPPKDPLGVGCLWSRLSGLSGNADETIAFGISEAPVVRGGSGQATMRSDLSVAAVSGHRWRRRRANDRRECLDWCRSCWCRPWQAAPALFMPRDGSAHPAPTAPEVRFDTNMNGYIESEELKGAVASFFAQHMGKDDLFKLVLLQRHREYIPPPSLLDMRDAARDGIKTEWRVKTRNGARGCLGTVMATTLLRPGWFRGTNGHSTRTCLEDERRLLYNLQIDFSNDEIAVEDILRVATLPWMFDANQTRAENDVRWFVTLTLSGESRPFAEKLLSKGWVLDDITPREWSIIHDLIVVHEADPEMSGYLLDEIEPPIDQLDKELARAARSLAVSAPAFGKGTAEWDRLRTEPWFLDGLDTFERVFLTTVPVYDALRQHLFSPDRIFIDSKTITLPLKGNVTLWVYYEASTKIRNAHELLPELEEAVRGAEEFVGVPFPKDHVIMFLWDIGAGGRKILGPLLGNPPFQWRLRTALYNPPRGGALLFRAKCPQPMLGSQRAEPISQLTS